MSASFKALWGDKALRERIVAIACVELEAWEGGFAEEERSSVTLPCHDRLRVPGRVLETRRVRGGLHG